MKDQLALNTSSQSVPPWMEPTCFQAAPTESAYGYWVGGKPYACQSRDELVERLRIDASQNVDLVWTPEVQYLVPPEEIPDLFEAMCERAQAHVKKRRDTALGTAILLSGLLLLVWFTIQVVAPMLLLALVVLGVIPLAESIAEQHRVRTYSAQHMAREVPAARFRAWVSTRRFPWTWGLVACIGVIYVLETFLGKTQSIAAAGLVKAAVRQGEWWRVATSALLHANDLHILNNGVALLGLGALVEVVGNRAYVMIVFLTAAVTGSLFSLLFLPTVTSVGASGGILGLLGFSIVLGYVYANILPLGFLRSTLTSVVYVAVIGGVFYQVIDNAGHLGGLLAGVMVGTMGIDNRQSNLPLRVSQTIDLVGRFAGVVILLGTLLCAKAIIFGRV